MAPKQVEMRGSGHVVVGRGGHTPHTLWGTAAFRDTLAQGTGTGFGRQLVSQPLCSIWNLED